MKSKVSTATRQAGYAHRKAIQSTINAMANTVSSKAKTATGFVFGYVAGFIVGPEEADAVKAQKRNVKRK